MIKSLFDNQRELTAGSTKKWTTTQHPTPSNHHPKPKPKQKSWPMLEPPTPLTQPPCSPAETRPSSIQTATNLLRIDLAANPPSSASKPLDDTALHPLAPWLYFTALMLLHGAVCSSSYSLVVPPKCAIQHTYTASNPAMISTLPAAYGSKQIPRSSTPSSVSPASASSHGVSAIFGF